MHRNVYWICTQFQGYLINLYTNSGLYPLTRTRTSIVADCMSQTSLLSMDLCSILQLVLSSPACFIWRWVYVNLDRQLSPCSSLYKCFDLDLVQDVKCPPSRLRSAIHIVRWRLVKTYVCKTYKMSIFYHKVGRDLPWHTHSTTK